MIKTIAPPSKLYTSLQAHSAQSCTYLHTPSPQSLAPCLKLTGRRYIRFFVLFFVIMGSCPTFAQLFPKEKLIEAGGAQTLVYFEKGDKNKPLVIFIPGDSHLARIAYGYPNGRAEDFLSYWLHNKGYSFLGISYPLDNPVFTKSYPSFTIKNWGEQAAEVSDALIKEHGLPKKIIVLGWSMGGSIEQVITTALKKRGINVELFIGLAAVPPLPYVMQSGAFDTNRMLPNHLADRKNLAKVFLTLLSEQDDYNKHNIIPPSVYLSQFIGNIPTALAAEGYRYQNGHFIYNIEQTLKDGGVFDFANTPFIALIEDNAPSTAKISLFDPACWNFIRTEMIYHTYFSKKDFTKFSQSKWLELTQLINQIPELLKVSVHGNHFFFVGEKGAKATADQIDYLIDRSNKIKQQLLSISTEPRM